MCVWGGGSFMPVKGGGGISKGVIIYSLDIDLYIGLFLFELFVLAFLKFLC